MVTAEQLRHDLCDVHELTFRQRQSHFASVGIYMAIQVLHTI